MAPESRIRKMKLGHVDGRRSASARQLTLERRRQRRAKGRPCAS